MSARISFEQFRSDGTCSVSWGRSCLNTRIGFSTSPSPLSRLIRLATRGKVSHAFIVYWDPVFEQDVVLEADWNGLVKKTLVQAAAERQIIAILKPPVPIDAGLREAAKWLDAPYDYSGLVGMLWVLVCRATGRHPRNPLHRAGALFCSDVAMLLCQWGGYPGSQPIDAPCADPEAMMQWMLDTGSTSVPLLLSA